MKMSTIPLSLSPQCLIPWLCIIKYYSFVIRAVSYYAIFVQVIWGHPHVFAFCYPI